MQLLLLTLAALTAPDFGDDWRQATLDYVPARQKLTGFLASGDLEGAEQSFLGLVPEEKRSAAHVLMLGDTFQSYDPEFARKQHAKAFELLPEEPQVAQAWALELHRAGRCAEAEVLYARQNSTRVDLFAGFSRVDCLVRTGQLAEALALWHSASDSQLLSKAFRVLPDRIGGGETREHRRLVLRQAIATGSSEGAEELVFHDLMRPSYLRRFEVERYELDLDRALITKNLDPQSRRSRELFAVCDFWGALAERGFPSANGSELATKLGERLRELGWLEAGSEPPAHALVLRWATSALLESGLRKPSELLSDWERALSARLEEGDAGAGRALLEIQLAAGSPQALEAEQLLWSMAHELEAALALLARRGERLESSDPVLRAALQRFPSDVRLCTLEAQCARREGKGEREALARQIAAGFQPPGSLEAVQSGFERLDALLATPERR